MAASGINGRNRSKCQLVLEINHIPKLYAFAERAGVALTVIRKIEQGKENLNMEKVNQVLKMFGHTLAPVNARELSKNDE